MTERDTFTQFTGAFDRPVAPAPEFAARLRAQVLAELSTSQRMDIAATREVPNSSGTEERAMSEVSTYPANANGSGQPSYRHQTTHVDFSHPRHPERHAPRLLRWLPALEVAAAVMLVVMVFSQVRDPGDIRNAIAPEHASKLPGVTSATPSPPTSTNASMWGAGPGRTWEFGGVLPATAPDEPVVFPATEDVDNAGAGVVSGDTLVRVVAGRGGVVPTQQLEAVSISTGHRLWIVPLTIETVPAIAGGRVFIAAAEFGQAATETFVLALDLASGTELWRTPIVGPRETSWISVPLVVGSTVFVANDMGAVYALDSATGSPRWQALEGMERAIAPSGEPVIETAGMTAADDQHLYVITANAELVALNLDGGQVVWRVPLAPQYGDSFLGATLMTDDSSVILNLGFGSHPAEPVGGTELANTIIVSLDAQDGQQRWIRRGVPPTGVRTLAGGLVVAAITDDRTNDGSTWIAALRATDGTEVWRLTEIPIQSTLWSVAGDQILAIDPRGSLVALALRNGSRIWEVPLPPIFPTSPPLVTQNEIVVVGHNGEVAVWRI